MTFQKRVLNWLMECFSNEVCRDGVERNHRFLEESLELVQSLGCTRSEAHQLVDYVFGRPVGEPLQELGGTMVTLAALASCHDMDLNDAAEMELARVWTKIEKIRAKQLAKPKHSPLPEYVAPAQTAPKRTAQASEIEIVGWAILQSLHRGIEDGPQSWSDLAEDQEKRIKKAAVAAIEAVTDLSQYKAQGFSLPLSREMIAKAIYRRRYHISPEHADRMFSWYADKSESTDRSRMAIYSALQDADAVIAALALSSTGGGTAA